MEPHHVILLQVPLDQEQPRKVVEPLGMYYLHASLLRAGYTCDVVDFEGSIVVAGDALLDYFKRISPLFIGLSVTSAALKTAAKLVRRWKMLGLKVPIVLGGHHPTALPIETIRHTGCDFVLRGEADETLPMLAASLSQGRKLATGDVPGLVSSGSTDKALPPIVEVEDLSRLPWPSRFGSRSASQRTPSCVPILAARGCVYRCRFCYNSDPDRPRAVRRRDPDDVYAEILHLKQTQGSSDLFFLDDCFTSDRAWARKMADRLAQVGVGWSIQARSEEMADGTLAAEFGRCGCREVLFGIETVGTEAARQNRKSEDRRIVRAAVQACAKAGIATRGNFMLGFPEDTPGSLRESIREAVRLGLDRVEFMYVVPYPGSMLSLETTVTPVNWMEFSPGEPVRGVSQLDERVLFSIYQYAKTATLVRGLVRGKSPASLPATEVLGFWRDLFSLSPFRRGLFVKWQGLALIDAITAAEG